MLPEETATAADAAPGLEGVAAATESGFTEEGGEEEEGVSSSDESPTTMWVVVRIMVPVWVP